MYQHPICYLVYRCFCSSCRRKFAVRSRLKNALSVIRRSRKCGHDCFGKLEAWRYDGIGRLANAQVNYKVTHAYLWDATGNRLSYTGPAGTVDYTYPADSHRLLAIGTDERRYDEAGHTVATENRQFSYNAQGRLTDVTVGVLSLARYSYNGRGERVLRTDETGSTVSLYDDAGHWIGDYDAQGHAKQQVIWLDDLPIALLANGTVYDIRPDHLGTPRAVIDRTSKRAVWTWNAHGEAFGNDAPNEGPDGDGVRFVFDIRFPGQRYDAATGMNYNYFRDYDPKSGRYVQSDPIGLQGGLNTYTYATGDALNSIDPSGLDALVIAGGHITGSFNIFGHVANAVTGAGVFSYGNGTPLGSDVQAYLQKEVQKRNQLVTFIPSSSKMIKCSLTTPHIPE
ncbi:RHS repeat-associated core domain-containing protein [Pinirhizobacter sp.]|uniref:RHS repeat-associated core domain-containing protein n=1 Tax=Pinirhizobacter sp. TaxID=2950432 RepID=UPI002F40B435